MDVTPSRFAPQYLLNTGAIRNPIGAAILFSRTIGTHCHHHTPIINHACMQEQLHPLNDITWKLGPVLLLDQVTCVYIYYFFACMIEDLILQRQNNKYVIVKKTSRTEWQIWFHSNLCFSHSSACFSAICSYWPQTLDYIYMVLKKNY